MRQQKLSPSIRVGSHVRVNEAIPGLGGALDRYGVVVAKDSSLKFKVKLTAGPKAGQEVWIRIEDLVQVRGK